MVAAFALVACGGGTQGQTTTPVGDPMAGGGASGGGGPATGGGAPEAPVAKGNPRTDLIPRQVLFGNPERAGVQISPDGKYLSWLAPSAGVMNVWIAPADKLDQAKPVTADKTRPVRRYFWAYNPKYLLYLQDKGGDENFHLHRVDVSTGEVTDLTPIEGARADVYGLSPKKPNVIMIGLNDRDPKVFDVHQIDLTTGKRSLVVQNDQAFVGFELDTNLDVRFGQQMKPDGSMAVLAYAPKTKTSWAPYDVIAGDDMMTTGMIGFDKTSTSYYAYDSRGRDTGALYKVNAKTKKKTLLYEDKRVDIGGVMMHPTERTIQAVEIDYDKPTYVVIDPKVKKDLAAIEKLSPGVAQVASRTLDDKTWIVAVDTDVGSPRYYRWDRRKQKGEFLFSARPALDDQPLVPMHPVVIPSRDKLELVSYLTLPKSADADGDGKAEKPAPMVLLVHGGPWARDHWGYNPLHQLLANRGYAVLSVNYRGSTGFGKGFINASNLQWSKKMHDDLLDAVAWAVAAKVAPKDQVCIMGGSYGGYATLVGLAMTPDVFACGVDIVGPSNIITLLETIPPYWAPMLALFHARVGNPSTPAGKQALMEASPLTHASRIKRPLLIGQGANDPRVKQSESDQIVKALQAKQIPVSYVLFPDEGHGFARPENSIAFWAVTEAFLSVHLGGFFQPITDEELKASTMKVPAGRAWLPGLPAANGK